MPCAGLRLWALRQFQAFFASIASPPWRTVFSRFAFVVNMGLLVLASVANRAVKPTRLRRAAYFRSLAPLKTTLFKPMLIQTAFSFSSVVQRWVCCFSGLRLLALCRFMAFLASSHFSVSASSYCFRSAAQPWWRSAFSQFVPVAKSKLSFLASGSNISVKPTRILRSAYLARWASERVRKGSPL